ncbi:hypothetical protein [uncultured Campylobacter sp.]|uniref:hypothetical protein n=1 Tax=uncultured Campylobacter sp. TaxID=218934 RepID=UPI002622B7E7|nr:hypothetical protein [uncultured Campylobacter sp.]
MKKLEEDYTGYEFTYFTYEEYDKMLNTMLYNIYKNTFVDKDDLKQELIMFIMRLEKKIFAREDEIDNIKGYIVHCVKMKTRTLAKEFFERLKKENSSSLDIIDDVVSDNSDIENYIINKSYINDLFDYYKISEDDRNLLLWNRPNNRRNERFILNRRLKNNVLKKDKEKWKIENE